MSSLQIGRLTLACDPETFQASPRRGADRLISIRSGFTAASLNQMKAFRDELAVTLAQSGQVIPLIWDEDGTVDGFYRPAGGSVELRSLSGTGFAEFKADLEWLGDDNSIRFCSLVTGACLTNDHSYTTDLGYVGPPVSVYGFSPASTGSPTSVLRAGEDGSSRCYLGVADSANPEWHAAPADFYKNACEVTAGGYLRAGLTCPNTPTDWLLSNGLVKAAPTTDGALIVSHYDGAAWRSTTWTVSYDGSAVGNWLTVTPLVNRPERAAVRLIQNGRRVMDLGVRRGSRILEGVFYSDDATKVMLLDTDSSGTTTGTPTGTMKKASDDTNGHRWMIGSEKTTTLTTADGSMSKTTARMPFMISKEINEGGGVQSGDTDDNLWDQYMGWRSELVRAVLP
jgi:hypothetical protein